MKKLFTLLFLAPFFVDAQVCIHNSSSLSFDGVSSYVQINSDVNLQLDSAMTVEAWVKAISWGFDTWDNTIFCKHSWSNGEQGYVLRAGGNGTFSLNFAGFANSLPTSWEECISPQNSLQLNTWYHVAGTFDGDTIRLYLNGVKVADSAFHGTQVPATSYPPCIGKLSDPLQSQTRYWRGRIDEVRVWNRALSQSEIEQKMSVHLDPSQETGLVGYWRLNDSTGTSVSDISGNNNNGTAYFTTWQTTDVPFSGVAPIPVITQSGDLLLSSPASSYQWFLSGNSISGATDQSYLVTQNGSYSVQITDAVGCTAFSDSIEVIATGISAIGNDHVQVLGNPASTNIKILLPENFNPARTTLMDEEGKVIQEIIGSTQSSVINFYAGNLPAGLYLVRVYGEGRMFTTKIVIGK